MKTHLITFLSVITLLATLTGCGEEVEPLGNGSVEVSWAIQPRGCEAADIGEVEVRLENAHRDYAERFACSEGIGRLDQISAANYDLVVAGLDNAGQETFISQTKRVTVPGERVKSVDPVDLSAKPATLRVSWRFENSKVCGANGVREVEVALFDDAYYEVARRTFACDDGYGVIEEVRAGHYTVEAVAEASESEVFHGITETSLKRGDDGQTEVVLSK